MTNDPSREKRSTDLTGSTVETLIGIRRNAVGQKMVVVEWRVLVIILFGLMTLIEGGSEAAIQFIKSLLGAP